MAPSLLPKNEQGYCIVQQLDVEKNEHRVCPICFGNNFLAWKLGLVRCNGCRAIFSPQIFLPNSNEEKNEEWFGKDYKVDKFFWVSLFESWNNRRTLGRLESAGVAGGGLLLEIGVGSGAFLHAAKQKDFEVAGCDLSSAICRRVHEHYGIKMYSEPLEELTLSSKFDVIVMNHVLEHVQRPLGFLSAALDLLKPGGVAHITVPNVACWEAKCRGWASFEPYHLIYFTPRILEQTVVKCGFEIKQLATYDSFSGWFLALLRLGLGINRENGAVNINQVSGPLACRSQRTRSGWTEHAYRVAMVTSGAGLWPLRWIQARLGFGDEVVCIARKPGVQSGPAFI